jgi:hypothetical protein
LHASGKFAQHRIALSVAFDHRLRICHLERLSNSRFSRATRVTSEFRTLPRHRCLDDFLLSTGSEAALLPVRVVMAKRKPLFVPRFNGLNHANPSLIVICGIHPPQVVSDDDDAIVVGRLSNDLALCWMRLNTVWKSSLRLFAGIRGRIDRPARDCA